MGGPLDGHIVSRPSSFCDEGGMLMSQAEGGEGEKSRALFEAYLS